MLYPLTSENLEITMILRRLKMRFISGSTSKGGHYSPGVISNGVLYISGQLPIDHSTGKIVEGGFEMQVKTALANVEAILKAADLSRDSVVMCRAYIPAVQYWDVFNRVYAEFFAEHKPARVVVPSRDLHNGALVEIEAIAEIQQ